MPRSLVIVLAWCALVASIAACGGGAETAVVESPGGEAQVEAPTEMRAEEVYPGEGSATLKVDRTWNWVLGEFVMVEEFTIQTQHGLVGEPGETNRVFGSTESEFHATIVGTGTGGSHTTTATGPVTYEVGGVFYPGSEGCAFDLVVTETIHLSQVTSMENSVLGVLPVPEGLGADEVSRFEVEFDEQSLDFFIIAGAHNSAFTLTDVVLPDGTGCNFTG